MVFTEEPPGGVPSQLGAGIALAEEKYATKLKINMEIVPLLRDNEDESYNNGNCFLLFWFYGQSVTSVDFFFFFFFSVREIKRGWSNRDFRLNLEWLV